MASIKKNPSGTYTATVYVGRDATGKQLFKYVTKPTEKECKSAARKLEDDIEMENLMNVDTKKFSDFAVKWLEIKKPNIASSTYIEYKMYIETHFNSIFGAKKLNQITQLHIKQYVSDKLKIGLSANTIKKHFTTLKQILDDGLKNKNPCIGVKLPKIEKYHAKALSKTEFDRIHKAFKGTKDEIMLLLAAWCGLRLSEILALKWNDIDSQNCTITVDEAMGLTEEEGYAEKNPKSERGKRNIVVTEEIIQLLEQKRKEQVNKSKNKKEINKDEPDISPFIFSIRPDSYSERWGKLIDRHNKAFEKGETGIYKSKNIKINIQDAPLEDVRFHDLRHYHAYLLYDADIPDIYAAERLGHDIMVLKKIYQQLDKESKKAIDSKVINIFKKQPEAQ
jgi:integrase